MPLDPPSVPAHAGFGHATWLLFLPALMAGAMALCAPSGADAQSVRMKHTYHVCHNDSVKSVAELLGVDEKDLRRWNRNTIRGNRFKQGTQRAVFYSEKPWDQESVGRPNGGSLVGGVNLDCDGDDMGSGWIIGVQRINMYGTPETIRNIRTAAKAYKHYFLSRGSKYVPLAVGDLSRRDGGPLPPHVSHQSGRDVDIGIIRVRENSPGRFYRATARSMDTLRTWVMIKSFLDTGDVQYIFIHRDLAAEIRRYVERIYKGNRTKAAKYLGYFRSDVIQGDNEHKSHIHIRFRCPKGDRRCIP